MTRNLFSVPIFFIVFRETLEAAIIISVLLGLVEQIVRGTGSSRELHREESHDGVDSKDHSPGTEKAAHEAGVPELADEDRAVKDRQLIRKLRIQILAGSSLGLLIALAIGAAFIAVWFTQASNLWAKSEELWEGIFSLIAALMIFVMGLSILKMDRAKAKWRVKIQHAFEGVKGDRDGKAGRWVLFVLPFITVLREGMEAVIFVGGVALGQPAESIPIAAICGILCGLIIGWLIYAFASRSTLRIFMIVMTNFILLIGAGLFSKAAGNFSSYRFNKLLGADLDDLASAGNGPGSYDVRGNVWHLGCCNPENKWSDQGWIIFGAIFGWTNNATVGSVVCYVVYWLAVIATLVFMKMKEGRARLYASHAVAAGARGELPK